MLSVNLYWSVNLIRHNQEEIIFLIKSPPIHYLSYPQRNMSEKGQSLPDLLLFIWINTSSDHRCTRCAKWEDFSMLENWEFFLNDRMRSGFLGKLFVCSLCLWVTCPLIYSSWHLWKFWNNKMSVANCF